MNNTSRQLRIFISSTFRDMQQEREELIKYVFPKIKKLAQERFIDITEIDLRWGITEDEVNSGKTLKICLDEINKCKDSPIFFIGILGDRYGWVPNAIDKKFFTDSKYTWIQEYKDKSVTELEILYAVLSNPPKNQKSFFYFRDESLSNTISKQLNLKTCVDQKSKQQLSTLKQNIKDKTTVSLDGYKSIEEFAEQVYTDIVAQLDILFPKDETPSEIEKVRLIHAQFAQSRKKIYIKAQDIIAKIDNYFVSDKPYLAIHAPSGMGKSSLIANYIDYYQSNYPNNYIIEHYIGGAGEQSADGGQLLFRILHELKETFKIQQALPKYDEIFEQFALWIYNIPKEQKVTIFIDAIDQLQDEKAKKLIWLPRTLPENIKIVLSSIENLEIENSITIDLKPLKKEKQKELISSYLEKYSKTLSNQQLETILNADNTDNTLYLKTLLDELRVFGEFELLNSHIHTLLQYQTLEDLFAHILQRIESDYDINNTFKDILSLLWCSRAGLSENEILEIINGVTIDKFQDYIDSGQSLTLSPLELSDVLLGIDEHILYKNDLITYFHRYLSAAVQNLYIDSKAIENHYRTLIADYFEKKLQQSIDIDRVARELPYQLFKEKKEKELLSTISNSNILTETVNNLDYYNGYEILKYYSSISSLNNKEYFFYDNLKIIQAKLMNEYAFGTFNNLLAFLVKYIPNYKKNLQQYKKLLYLCKKRDGANHENTYDTLINLSCLYVNSGNYNYALKICLKLESLSISEKLKMFNLNNKALSLSKLGYFEKSLAINKELLEMQKKYYKKINEFILTTMNNIATNYFDLNEYDKSLSIHFEILENRKKLLGEYHFDITQSLNNIAVVYERLGNLRECMKTYALIHKLQNKLFHEDYHPIVATTSHNFALCLFAQGEIKEAIILSKEIIKVRKNILGKEHLDTISSISNLGLYYHEIKNNKLAILYSEIAYNGYQEAVGNKHQNTLQTMHQLAGILSDSKKNYKALQLLKKIIAIQKKQLVSNDYKFVAYYYDLAKNYFEIGNKKKSKFLLKMLIQRNKNLEEGNFYINNAKQLLSKIKI